MISLKQNPRLRIMRNKSMKCRSPFNASVNSIHIWLISHVCNSRDTYILAKSTEEEKNLLQEESHAVSMFFTRILDAWSTDHVDKLLFVHCFVHFEGNFKSKHSIIIYSEISTLCTISAWNSSTFEIRKQQQSIHVWQFLCVST